MKAVVLAAGQGTRMRPLSESVPKPMLPVADRPLAAHTVDAAIDAGADEIVLVIGYEARRSVTTSAPSTGASRSPTPSRRNRPGPPTPSTPPAPFSSPFAVLNGDNLYDPAAIDRLFDACPAVCAIEVDEPRNYGVLSTADGSVTGIVEKPDEPPTNLANAGAYAFPAEAREWLAVPASERGEHEITDVVARVIDEYDVTPVTLERWLDVGRPWELLAANEWHLAELDGRIDGDVSDDAHLEGEVVVEAGATVEPGVVIEGPA